MQFSSLIGEVGMEMEELEMYSPEAILWVRPTQTVRPLIPEIRKKIPVCVIADSVRNDSFAVTSDYYQAGAKAAEYFICNGFRNILLCLQNEHAGFDYGSFPVKDGAPPYKGGCLPSTQCICIRNLIFSKS